MLFVILFRLFSEYLEGYGDLKIGQVICTVKYADDPVLLAKKQTVQQRHDNRIDKIGKC
jgi:hypothetical protein